MPPEFPLNAAHQHAANAEDYLGQGLLVLAAQEHLRAAEAYISAHANSHDDSTKRTLKLLHNDHTKAASELQRKIETLKLEGKDPNVPQKMHKTSLPHTMPRSLDSPKGFHHNSVPEAPLTETVDESFMILQGQKTDPADSFNQFWNVMQQALDDHLSQPLAFATIPLGIESGDQNGSSSSPRGIPREGSQSSDTDADEPIVSRITKHLQGMSSKIQGNKLGVSSGLAANIHIPQDDDLPEVGIDDDDELSESFMLIPSGSGSPQKSSALETENSALKAEVETLRKQLESHERLKRDQEAQLRGSLYHATREAHRMFSRAQLPNDPSGPPASPSIVGVHTGREAQYVRRVQELDHRVKELEDGLRLSKAEAEKYKAMNVKFKERWDKLKENARKKKEAKAKAEMSQDRIEEDPEAEERLDGVLS